MELLGVDKLYIETMADNRIIARGVERMGMTREALLRGHVVRDGRSLDVLLYTMLGDGWRAIRTKTLEKWGTPEIVEAITA
jgi:RimJ/RimL family protein N-acetyltransferase